MGINVFNNNLSIDSSVAGRRTVSLQDGTTKWLPNGTARACYAMLSNGTGATGGIAFYDKYFHQVVPEKNISGSTIASAEGNYQNAPSGDIQVGTSLLGNAMPTGTAIGSGTTANSLASTNSAGEFGNIMLDVFSNATAVPFYSRSINNIKVLLNATFVDSDHAKRELVYILYGGVLRAVARVDGAPTYDFHGTTGFTISGLNVNMRGSASYNVARRELVLLHNVSTNSFTLITYQGVDFDAYPSPTEALTRSGVVRTDKAFVIPSWTVSNAESQYSAMPTLCNDGSVYVTTMFGSNSFSLYKITRDAALTPTIVLVASKVLTTSYGRDQGDPYGQRRIQSRNGTSVFCFCPYYYYGSGSSTFIIDKKLSTTVASVLFDRNVTASGCQPVQYGDDGFSMFLNGNVYAGNFSGATMVGCFQRNSLDALVLTSDAFYLPYFPIPNTTNYPGLTQVTDYSMLTNQYLV
jgi:hypothetical protein